MIDPSVIKSIARHNNKMYKIRRESEVRKYLMLETIVKAIIIGVVLIVIYYLAQLVIAALGLPPVILTLIAVLLVLVFIIWLIRSFGISF